MRNGVLPVIETVNSNSNKGRIPPQGWGYAKATGWRPSRPDVSTAASTSPAAITLSFNMDELKKM